MRAVIQRVERASVAVEKKMISQIDQGLLVFVGIESTDLQEDVIWLARKIAHLRIFQDESSAMNRSVQDIAGDLLVVSQFTLLASTRKGNRPSFIAAAAPELAVQRYEEFCQQLQAESVRPVHRGVFGAHMKIELVNDGPVTIWIDTRKRE
jgi:D-aminoacyl-tRNA deacylase